MAYEVLQQFDFPIGHLPKGATGYELNNLTGDYKPCLGEGTCSFLMEGSYDLKYKSTIKVRTALSEWYLVERVSKQSFCHLVPIVPQVPPALMRNSGRFYSSYDLEEAMRGYDAFPLTEVGD